MPLSALARIPTAVGEPCRASRNGSVGAAGSGERAVTWLRVQGGVQESQHGPRH